MTQERQFRSKWGFILACVGSAVGMANVWGFPYRLGMYGGGAFLIAYLFFIVIFSFTGLAAEYAIGRRARTGTLGSYAYAWEHGRNNRERTGTILGWIPLAGSMCIAIGYAIIIAYVLKALVASVGGTLMTEDPSLWFKSFSLTPYSVIPYHLIVIVATILTLFFGAESIEKTNKIMMPLFFIIFVILAIRISFLDGAIEGYKFMFMPRWEALKNPITWIFAMGQAFFSLSITGSGMIVYGAYLSDKENIVESAAYTGFFDTTAALVAALVMIPACCAYDMDLAGGPGLLFVIIPTILQDIPMGQLFSVILYIAVIFGGISSLQNMLEVVAESLMHRFPKIRRKVMLTILALICFVIGVNMEAIFYWGPWMDFVCIYIIPIGAMLGAISWFWIMKKEVLLDEINKGASKIYGNFWYAVGRYPYVIVTMVINLYSLINRVSL